MRTEQRSEIGSCQPLTVVIADEGALQLLFASFFKVLRNMTNSRHRFALALG
jgi:hypothetical protein